MAYGIFRNMASGIFMDELAYIIGLWRIIGGP
jgi:hypothetical protein